MQLAAAPPLLWTTTTRTTTKATATPLLLRISLAPFHSTAPSLAKWKSKWSPKGEGSAHKPSKTYIRYAVRQKRADAKRALKDFLLYGKPSKLHCQDEDLGWCNDRTGSRNSGNSKSHNSSFGKGKHGGRKRWKSKYTFCYDDDDYEPPETKFQAAFAGHRGFTWRFSSWENFNYENPTSGFEWEDQSRWAKTRRTVWSESDTENSPTDIVSHTHRRILGLSLTGPVTLDDVKCAFRASALKWHPDKHQGPSQAIAEERFKQCVESYNTLCQAFKSG